jgi:IS30 family transposase
MDQHHGFSIVTDVAVHFRDPQSPWQRGTNQKTNRLLRQTSPMGPTPCSTSQSDLEDIARLLNGATAQDTESSLARRELSQDVTLTD